MGTPAAVVYSNLVILYIESTIPYCYSICFFYKRYIDDLFRICPNTYIANQFISHFNLVCPSIQIKDYTVGVKGIFLDLELELHSGNHLISHKIYQKLISKYQYIPPFSYHKKHIFFNWVFNEFCRYRLYCLNDIDYVDISVKFSIRLLNRGYSLDWIVGIKSCIPSRNTLVERLLYPSSLQPSTSTTDQNILINISPEANIPSTFKTLKSTIFSYSDFTHYKSITLNSLVTYSCSKSHIFSYILDTLTVASKYPKSLQRYLTSSKPPMSHTTDTHQDTSDSTD